MELQSILLPVSSLFGVALGGSLQFFFGRALEARKQLTGQKSQSYVDYFKAVVELLKTMRKDIGKTDRAVSDEALSRILFRSRRGKLP